MAQVKIVRETLGTLGMLGGQTSGLYSVILCGSSTSTHRLICGKPAFPEAAYPLVKGGVPNLNDTKYSRLVIPSPRCTDWRQTRVMLDTMLGGAALLVPPEAAEWPGTAGETDADEYLRQVSRLITFFVGSTPRALRKLVNPDASGLSAVQLPDQIDKSRTSGARYFLSPEAVRLLDELLRRLVAANKKLSKALRNNDGSCNIQALLTDDWEEKVASIDFTDAQTAFLAIAKESNFSLEDAFFHGVLGELADHGLVAIRNDRDGMGDRIWPSSTSQIVYAHSTSLTSAALKTSARLLQPLVLFMRKVNPLIGHDFRIPKAADVD